MTSGGDESPAGTRISGGGAAKPGCVVGEVMELLPSAIVRVKLANQEMVLAHAADASKLNFVRVRPGDRVQVEISPHDRTRGRITRLLK
jgi:translation initiation factor IF-1